MTVREENRYPGPPGQAKARACLGPRIEPWNSANVPTYRCKSRAFSSRGDMLDCRSARASH